MALTDDEVKKVYYELKHFRGHVDNVRRSLASRTPDPVSFILDGLVDYQKPITNAIELDQEIRRQEQESMRIQQQQAEYNNKLNYLHSLEFLDDLLTFWGKNNKWDGIQLLLIFYKENRPQELWVAEQLVQLNRFDDLSKLAKLRKQGSWADIQTVCSLAYYGNWNEVTARLAEMTTLPESRNLFNESMLTGELKDMYQHYLFLKENNQMDESQQALQ